MAEKHSVAMFIQGDDGERVQVGWASPKDESGVRTFEYSPGFEGTHPRDVSFEDDELSQLVAEEQHESRLGDGSDAEEFEVAINPAREDSVELARVPFDAEPVYERPAETDAQDAPRVDAAPDEDEAAEPVEEVSEDEETDQDETPALRRDLRKSEDNK